MLLPYLFLFPRPRLAHRLAMAISPFDKSMNRMRCLKTANQARCLPFVCRIWRPRMLGAQLVRQSEPVERTSSRSKRRPFSRSWLVTMIGTIMGILARRFYSQAALSPKLCSSNASLARLEAAILTPTSDPARESTSLAKFLVMATRSLPLTPSHGSNPVSGRAGAQNRPLLVKKFRSCNQMVYLEAFPASSFWFILSRRREPGGHSRQLLINICFRLLLPPTPLLFSGAGPTIQILPLPPFTHLRFSCTCDFRFLAYCVPSPDAFRTAAFLLAFYVWMTIVCRLNVLFARSFPEWCMLVPT